MCSRGKYLVALAQGAISNNRNDNNSNSYNDLTTALKKPLLFLEECVENHEQNNLSDINLFSSDCDVLNNNKEHNIIIPEPDSNTYVFNLPNIENVITFSLANNINENTHHHECSVDLQDNCQKENLENIENAENSETQDNIIPQNIQDENVSAEEKIMIHSDVEDPNYIVDSSQESSSSAESTKDEEVSKTIVDHGTENASEDLESVRGTRKGKRNCDTYRKIKRKHLRNLGQEYENVNGKVVPARKVGDIDRSKCKLKCASKFTEEERQTINNNYWSLGLYTRQRDFICQTVDYVAVKRRRSVTANKKERNKTYIYHFNNINNGSKEQVCKKFFLKTLDIGERTVFVAKKKQVIEISPFVSDDKIGRHPPHHKLSEIDRQKIKTHIESFPCLESHYCRQRTKRQYLSSGLNISKMFDLFKEKSKNQENNMQYNTKFGSYSKIFNTEYNLSFHHPKKDACRVCENHKNLTEDEKKKNQKNFENHNKNKDLARSEKEKDKITAKENPHGKKKSAENATIVEIVTTICKTICTKCNL